MIQGRCKLRLPFKENTSMKKIKLVVIYQVIMHYRLPLYERLASDPAYDFTLLYGDGQEGSKLYNADITKTHIKAVKMHTIRIPFKTNNGEGTIPLSYSLFFHLIRLSPDVIVSEGSSSLINSTTAFFYSQTFGKKFIWWSLGKLQSRKHLGFRRLLVGLERMIERKTDAIFTYSTLGKRHFVENGSSPEKVFVGVNVLDTEKKLLEINQYEKEDPTLSYSPYFNISFIGSIIKVKNLEVLVDVVGKLNKKFNNQFRLHLIGDGPHMAALQNYVESKGLNIDVYFHGRINVGASKILSHCQLMVLPGLGGLAICEAMLNRLPVITGQADGTEKDLVSPETGFVLKVMNHSNLLEKIEYMYLNPSQRKKMSQLAYEQITTKFHFDQYYKMLAEAINFTLK